MYPQPRRFCRRTRQVDTLSIWIKVQSCTQAGKENQVVDTLSRLNPHGNSKARLEDDISELQVVLVQHVDLQNNEQDSSLADKCRVRECFDFPAGEPQNLSTQLVATVLARAADILREVALPF